MIKKVLVSGHDLKFWYPLQQQLEVTGLFEFKEDQWRGHNDHNPAQTLELIEWADIIVAEWTLGNAVFCANHKKPHQIMITRFHAQEIRTEYPLQLDKSKIDLFIFVGPHLLEQAIIKFDIPRKKTRLIHNFVDFNKYNLNKINEGLFNLGMIGISPTQKRLDRSLDILEELFTYDHRYMLHIKGPSPTSYNWLWARTKEREYYENIYERINSTDLRYKVIFDPPGNDVNHWLTKIGFILSPSESESFHMALAEGMSSGCVPIPWKREGVEKIFSPFQTFDSPKSVAKFIHLIQKSTAFPYVKYQAKNFIKNNFDKSSIIPQWVEILSYQKLNLHHSANFQRDKKVVLIVYSIDNWETFHRREMLESLGRNLADYADLLIVEPGSHYQTILNKWLCSETELNSYAQLKPIQVADNIFKIRILQGYIPNNAKLHPALKAAGSYENAIQVATKHIFGDKRKIIHWIYKPNQRHWVPKSQAYIYEVYDEYTLNFSTGVIEKEMAELEPKVLTDATHIFFTSDPLAERKKKHCHSYSIVGNGVAFEVFNNYRVDVLTQPNLRHSVGYLGNLSDFFDWPLMLNICEKMPEIDFFFHGQVEYHRLEKVKTYVEKLQDLPNTYFSGRISRPVGAASINRYDALIIPFVINEAMHAVNPLKLWEYFATGKPVVSSPMDAVKIPEPYLLVADTVEKWIDALKISVIEVDEVAQSGRLNLAKANSWDKLTKLHADIIQKL